eukprot:666379-Prymnesium_polylepis.1
MSRPTQLAARSRRSRCQGDGQCSPPHGEPRRLMQELARGSWQAAGVALTARPFLRSRGGSLSNLIRAADGTTSTLA